MKTIYIKIGGMTCNHCQHVITQAIKNLSWVVSVEVSLEKNYAIITYNTEHENHEEIINIINDLGYKTSHEDVFDSLEDLNRSKKQNLYKILLTFFYIILIYLFVKRMFGFDLFTAIPSIDNTLSLSILLLIGIMTSIHCVGMCGGINLIASTGIRSRLSIKRPLLYNLRRVISYTIIGGIAGLIGKALTPNLFMQGILVGFAAVFMLLMGLSMLGVVSKKILNILPKNNKLAKIKSSSPFTIGLLNGLMPCGPLQAMQVYAISTASFFLGALSMLLFALGTVPLMLLFGLLVNYFKTKHLNSLQRISAVLVIILSFVMFTRAMGYLGINVFISESAVEIAEIREDGYQYVKVEVQNSSYAKIYAQKGIPLRINFKVEEGKINGCNNPIMIPKYDIEKKLTVGDNYIEFTPTETTTYSCWMSMIRDQIVVVENINEID